ncbi:MAG TPA: hypothetical protein VGQ51_13240 [Puia sp.]|jgi:hypothetical protein|nr:hypothetical protein [Puia sp.]
MVAKKVVNKQKAIQNMAKFQPGVSGNKAGKPAGVSRKQKLLNAFAQDIVSGGTAKFKRELNSLKGRSYVEAYLTLLEYVQPKLARVEHLGDGNNMQIITVKLEDEATGSNTMAILGEDHQ